METRSRKRLIAPPEKEPKKRKISAGQRLSTDRIPTELEVLEHIKYLRQQDRSMPNADLNRQAALDIRGVYLQLNVPVVEAKIVKAKVEQLRKRKDALPIPLDVTRVVQAQMQEIDPPELQEADGQQFYQQHDNSDNESLNPFDDSASSEFTESSESSDLEDDRSDSDFDVSDECYDSDKSDESRKNEKKNNVIDFSEVTEMADRIETTSATTAAIVNSTIACLIRQGFIDPTGNQPKISEVPAHLLFDRKKVERKRKEQRLSTNEAYFENLSPVHGLFVDGKGISDCVELLSPND